MIIEIKKVHIVTGMADERTGIAVVVQSTKMLTMDARRKGGVGIAETGPED